jgi:hypothetical protein
MAQIGSKSCALAGQQPPERSWSTIGSARETAVPNTGQGPQFSLVGRVGEALDAGDVLRCADSTAPGWLRPALPEKH